MSSGCKLRLIKVLPLLFLLVFCLSCSSQPPAQRAEIGKPAPQFSLYTNQGEKWSLADQKGKVVLVNFWATSCPPCRAEMPSMQKLYASLPRDKFEILSILYNDDPSIAQNFVKKFRYTFPVLIDYKSQIAGQYGITGVPETFVIDPEGILREKYIGAHDWNSAKSSEMINKYLKQ